MKSPNVIALIVDSIVKQTVNIMSIQIEIWFYSGWFRELGSLGGFGDLLSGRTSTELAGESIQYVSIISLTLPKQIIIRITRSNWWCVQIE